MQIYSTELHRNLKFLCNINTFVLEGTPDGLLILWKMIIETV